MIQHRGRPRDALEHKRLVVFEVNVGVLEAVAILFDSFKDNILVFFEAVIDNLEGPTKGSPDGGKGELSVLLEAVTGETECPALPADPRKVIIVLDAAIPVFFVVLSVATKPPGHGALSVAFAVLPLALVGVTLSGKGALTVTLAALPFTDVLAAIGPKKAAVANVLATIGPGKVAMAVVLHRVITCPFTVPHVL